LIIEPFFRFAAVNNNSAIIIALVCLGVTLALIVLAYNRLTYFYGFGNGAPLRQVQTTASEGGSLVSKYTLA
jgi:hypothetical protein